MMPRRGRPGGAGCRGAGRRLQGRVALGFSKNQDKGVSGCDFLTKVM